MVLLILQKYLGLLWLNLEISSFPTLTYDIYMGRHCVISWFTIHRITQWVRLETITVGSSDSSSLLEQGHPREQGTGLCPDDSGISPVGETSHLSGQPVSVHSHTDSKFSCIQGELPVHQFLSCCLLSYCSAPPRSACLHPLASPPLDILDTCRRNFILFIDYFTLLIRCQVHYWQNFRV